MTPLYCLLYVTFTEIILSAAESTYTVVAGNNDFAFDLTHTLHQDTSNNFWISPFSITSCFSLIYPGSSGETQSQIASTMHFPMNLDGAQVVNQFLNLQSSIESKYDGSKVSRTRWSNPSSIIHIANKIYSAKSLILKQSFVDTLSVNGTFFIDQNFNFESPNAKQRINQWVSTATDGLIDSVVPETMDISHWRLVALNAMYLKGSWIKPFKDYKTKQKYFYVDVSREEAVGECSLMSQTDYFLYFEDTDYQFVRMRFNDAPANLFALFVLPRNGHIESDRNGLITDWNVLNAAISEMETTSVQLELPRVSVEASFRLKDPLMEMGITNAFNSELSDFKGMSDEPLMIDAVIHKTMLEMDEKGLKAAAVTMIAMSRTSASMMKRPEPVLFKADHPYQMFIIDGEHENPILFMGQINNPGTPKDIPRDDTVDLEEVLEIDVDGNPRRTHDV